MIPKEAFMSLLLVMVISWAFGIVCDKMFTRWLDSFTEPENEPGRHACDTCKYEHTDPRDYPCVECAEDDMDMWEPIDIGRG